MLNLKDSFQSGKEWAEIQEFHCIPTFNMCHDFREQKNRNKWENIKADLRRSYEERIV